MPKKAAPIKSNAYGGYLSAPGQWKGRAGAAMAGGITRGIILAAAQHKTNMQATHDLSKGFTRGPKRDLRCYRYWGTVEN